MKTILYLVTISTLIFTFNNTFNTTAYGQSEGTQELRIASDVEAVNKIVAAIEKQINVDYTETKFGTVLQDLSRTHGIPIEIHESARDHALSSSSIANISLKGVTLYAALNDFLQPYYCTLTIEGKALLVVSKDYAKENTISWRFNLSNLLQSAYDGRVSRNAASLKKAIQTAVDLDSWREVGGTATITFLRDTMVVSQSLESLRKIHQLLIRLDKSIGKN